MPPQNNDQNKTYSFKVTIQDQRYYNEDSNYGVYNFTTEENIPEYQEYKNMYGEETPENLKSSTLVGKMQQLYIGSEYNVSTKLTFNKKYSSWQYESINVSAIVPKTAEAQKSFLRSIITNRQADILLSAYPNIVEDTINGKVDNIDLEKTKGIKEYTWGYIKERIINNYVVSDILSLLQPLGVTFSMIRKLLMSYSNSTLLKQELLDNPYILTKIHGLGFKRVDGLALKLRPDLKESHKRTYAFINYFLKDLGDSNGHTWVTFNTLENAIRDNISECEELYQEILNIERKTKALLYIENSTERIGLKYYRDIETSIYSILRELDGYTSNWELDIEQGIKEAEEELGFELSDEQKEVIREATKHNVVAISGKAGSGKTTISRALLKIYQNANKTIGAAALSAKAAQRIIEATGFQALTIHRLLGAKGFNEFQYNYQNPLPYDVILADEASMNNAKIIYDLISALKPGTRLILSGDCRQLPPIGFGNIFSDLLEMKEKFNIYELKKVHRQAEKSGILTDANMIRDGINPIQQPELKMIHGELQDMYYMFRDNREALNDIAVNMFLKSVKTDGLDNVILITPRRKDCINSTRELNIQIQNKLISNNQPYLLRGNIKFKLGAKVTQITNNYDKNIFNGDIGYIKEICEDKFIVEYPIKTIEYTKSELDQIDLAYCLTIHKCQGSGYQTVIAIIDNTHYTLLDSCLLYTALTRAKQRCLLLAEPSAFKKCINQNNSILRQTWFKELNDEIVGFNSNIYLNNIDKVNNNKYNETESEEEFIF
jgi:exodeoxyribonuclease V alpha subunit